jgi:NADH-quinone oxidoreductase subunit G
VRQAIAHQGQSRFEWQVVADLAKRTGLDLGVLTPGMALTQLTAAVPFYAGLTLDEIGGRGVRWQERDAASAFPAAGASPAAAERPDTTPAPEANGRLRLGTFRSIWAAPEVEASPALKFLAARQRAELSPADAQRLGVQQGQKVTVGVDGAAVQATVAVRSDMPAGTVFLEENVAEDGANALNGTELVEVRTS